MGVCGVVWCGVVWCGVVWCGVVWCGVVWCGVVVCVYIYRVHRKYKIILLQHIFNVCKQQFKKTNIIRDISSNVLHLNKMQYNFSHLI